MSDCCAQERLLPLAEAVATALELVEPVRDTETVSLLDADGRVLAADVLARLDTPPADQSAMDGFALYMADLHPERSKPACRWPDQHWPGIHIQASFRRARWRASPPARQFRWGRMRWSCAEQCGIAPDGAWIELPAATAARLRPGENIRRHGEDVSSGGVAAGARTAAAASGCSAGGWAGDGNVGGVAAAPGGRGFNRR